MTMLGGSTVMVTCLGCHQVWNLGPQAPAGDGEATVADSAQPAAALELEHDLRHLERRLAALEARLAPGQGPGSAEGLQDERLLLTVALVLVQRDIAAARRGERGDSLTVEQQLERASRRILQARQRLASGQAVPTGATGWASTREGLRQPLRPFTLAERDGRRRGARRQPAKSGGCSPGDPMCSALDGFDGDAGGEGEGDWTVRKPEPVDIPKPPPPPAEAQPTPVPTPVVPDPDGAAGRGAARVSHDQAPQGVSQVISRHHGQLTGCVPQAQRTSGLRLRVQVRLDTQGAFREPRVLATNIDPQAAACIEDVFRQMRITGYDRGSRHITVPLWLGGDS